MERMPAGIPGRVSRKSDVTLEPVQLGAAMLFGAPGKIKNGLLVPLADGDAVSAIYGFLTSPYPTQSDMAGLGAGSAPEGSMQSVMRRGYMTVAATGGTAAKNAAVRVVLDEEDGVVGSRNASAGVGTAIPGCVFQGEADADGNVEISFNI
jgi:hypothetical protein